MGTGLYLRDERLIRPVPLHVCAMGRFNSLPTIAAFIGAGISSVSLWPAANRAHYTPLSIPERFTISRFFVLNGTVNSGNINMGLYTAAGTLLVSTGSTLQSGITAIQFINIANVSFPPGDYYLALLASSTAARFHATGVNNQYELRMMGMLQEDVGSINLPATMTPVSYTSTAVYHYGFTQSDTL